MLHAYLLIALFVMIISVFKIEIPITNALVMGSLIFMLPILADKKENYTRNRKPELPEFVKK